MNSPRVSILIPTFRYGRYLPEALNSVLSQDFKDIEVLVSDDCSGDGSAELLHHYAARDARIRVCIQPVNLGMVQNWNWCLARARGEFVQYLFGDDLLTRPDAIRKMVMMLESHPEAVLSACARNVIDEQSRVLDVWSVLGKSGMHGSAETVSRCLIKGNIIGEPTAVMFRRSAALRGFSETYNQLVDLEMWLHLLERGPLVFTEEPLCGFRRHPLQRTVANTKMGLHQREILHLALDYGGPLTLDDRGVRRVAFHRLYKSRRYVGQDPEIDAARERLLGRIGRPVYWVRWVGKKLHNPIIEVGRWCLRLKRILLRRNGYEQSPGFRALRGEGQR